MLTFWEPNMKKLTSLGVVALAALLAGLVVVGFQSSAQAYPDVQINLEVNRSLLYGGQQFTATASSKGVTCSWTLEWNGDSRNGASSADDPFKTAYTAPEVTKITKIPLHGTCVYTAPSARGAATWQRDIMITVLPPSAAVSPPSSSNLPGTGGPNWMFLAGGVTLLLSGAIAVTLARRRAEEAELRTSQA
jgi:LPXTG-motif cell wall-anchored protein